MERIDQDLSNLEKAIPDDLTPAQTAAVKTAFYAELSLAVHRMAKGKMQTVPRVAVPGFNWFNVYYTPGISAVSKAIRSDGESSFELSGRGNTVAVVSDSTRVLGDGDCTPPGGLGVMEGKAFLMKYLGGIDAVPLCIDSRGENGKNDPERIIQFVKMVQHSFGAVNLEDISQPNCFRVLDVLREECDIPVWHDDAQGTASVTLAGVFNALKLTGKDISSARFVLLGAGASNTTIARLIVSSGGDPSRIILFDSNGALHKGRDDIKSDTRYYRKWELCETTNPERITAIEKAVRGADFLIALSTPGPDTVKKEWISSMAEKPVVFACANPVPEIYPYAAREAGAYIVATGRGDFPNQINNSTGFPGILKGALLVRARKITDNMAIAAARSMAAFAENRGITPDNIVPSMAEAGVFPIEAADVAVQAVKDGVARVELSREEAFAKAGEDINYSRELTDSLIKNGFIRVMDRAVIQNILDRTVELIKKTYPA